MITPDYVKTMARYGAWQNDSLAKAADPLGEAERAKDRGAFFGSIAGTLNHLLWGDRIWMHRFARTEKPSRGSIPDSVAETGSWPDYRAARSRMDRAISDWAETLDPTWLDGEMTWFSGAVQREVSKPNALLVMHFFNHATHHRARFMPC